MNLALFLPNWIGDVVMVTPAIRALRARYPDARLIGVCKPYVADVLGGSPWFDQILPLDKSGAWSRRWPGVAWTLRRQRVDLAVLFANTFRSGLAGWLGGTRQIVGFNRYGRGWMLSDALEPKRDSLGRLKPTPIIDDYNHLAVTAGSAWPGYRMELFTTPADEAAADQAWQSLELSPGRELICLNPGAAFGAAKHWPVEHFATLAQDLVDRRQAQILVLCGPSERDMARQIAQRAGRWEVRSLAEFPLSLGLSKAVIRRSDLLVTTDSGPRHFAAAFGRPVVTLFGPTHIAWTETYYDRGVHLQKKVPCGPCQMRVCPTDHRCMKELTPAEVFTASCDLLASKGRKPLEVVERVAS